MSMAINPIQEIVSFPWWKLSPDAIARKVMPEWQPWDYLVYISREIAKEILDGKARIIVEAPPRHGKSTLISILLPLWFLSIDPSHRIILTSYEYSIAVRWGARVRDIIIMYPELGIKIRSDSSAKDQWETIEGGGMICSGAGGPITGRGADLIIIDDPVKNWEEAQSSLQREKTIDWYKSVVRTRLEPNGSIILIQTRWHERDLAGYLLSEESGERWREIRLPAIAEDDDEIGRKPGEPLCPARFPLSELHKTAQAQGSFIFSAMFQQSPAPQQGTIFLKEWWRFDGGPERYEMIIQSWDPAYKPGEGHSYSACLTIGIKGDKYHVLDAFRGRLNYVELRQKVKKLAERWKPSAILIEDAASGQSLIPDLRNLGLNIIGVPVREKSKEIRAQLASPVVESGRVILPQSAPWLADFLKELSLFPNAENDDFVDAFSQAVWWLERGRGAKIRWL